jgi:hypothetical protein
MAQRKKSEIEFIQDTFCPQVAVLCSYDAEVVCRKNALTFVELVQPFAFGFNGESKRQKRIINFKITSETHVCTLHLKMRFSGK